MKYLCFDLGLSHTGIAVSYEGELSETLTTLNIKNVSQLFRHILQLIKAENPDVIVIGQPKRGPIFDLAIKLKKTIAGEYHCEVVLFNEDLSTSDVERHFISQKSTLAHRKKTQHQAVAAFLLQNYLDSL